MVDYLFRKQVTLVRFQHLALDLTQVVATAAKVGRPTQGLWRGVYQS